MLSYELLGNAATRTEDLRTEGWGVGVVDGRLVYTETKDRKTRNEKTKKIIKSYLSFQIFVFLSPVECRVLSVLWLSTVLSTLNCSLVPQTSRPRKYRIWLSRVCSCKER